MTRTANLADQLNAQANGLIIDSQGQNDECYNFTIGSARIPVYVTSPGN